MNDLLPHQPQRTLVWSDSLLDLFDALSTMDSDAYVVGGAVRDALLGRAVKDVDIATSGSGTGLARQIADYLGGAYYPLDVERDTGRVLLDLREGRLIIDVARFRGADLLADLRDRDFTINAMAVDLSGEPGFIIDPTEGERDARHRLIRRCNEDAIERDPVRVLRGIRQSVQLGFRIEPATVADLRRCAPLLVNTSAERVRDEWFRVLALPKASTALKIADAVGALGVVIPETTPVREGGAWQTTLDTIDRLVEIMITIGPQRTDQTAAKFSLGMLVMGLDRFRPALQRHVLETWADDRTHQALLVFTVLLDGVGAAVGEARGRSMPLSNREIARLSLLLRSRSAYRVLAGDRSPLALHRYWRTLGEAGVDLCLLALARTLAEAGTSINQDAWIAEIESARSLLEAYFVHHDQIVAPPPLVNGNDLMSTLSIKPGPRIGELLDAIREAQVQRLVLTTEDALTYARQLQRDSEEEQ